MTSVYYIQMRPDLKGICQERMSQLGDFIQALESSFLLQSSKPIIEIYQYLSAGIENPSLIIMKCDLTSYYGCAPKTVWEWAAKAKTK